MTKYKMIETVTLFRMRYVFELNGFDKEIDFSNTRTNFNDLSQKFLKEVVMDEYIITEDEAIVLFDRDNKEFKSWSRERKLTCFVNSKED